MTHASLITTAVHDTPATTQDADPLIAEWEALCRRAATTPFLHPQWTLAWWRAFSTPGDSLVVWHLRQQGRIAALLPMVQRGATLRSALNYHTPQGGLLADNANAAEALLSSVLRKSDARETVLAGLDSTTADPRICERVARATGHRALVLPHERASFIPLDEGWEAFAARLGRDVNSDVRRRRRRLQEMGTVSIDICDGSSDLAGLLDLAFTLEGSGWKSRNGTAILSDPRVTNFYADIARWAAAEGMLRLCFLRVDGAALAMDYALEYRGTWYLLKCGYDEQYHLASPGKVLMHDCIRHCFDIGMKCIELCGDLEAHKQRWNPQWRALQRMHLFAPSVPGRLAWARSALRPWLKRWYLRARPSASANHGTRRSAG